MTRGGKFLLLSGCLAASGCMTTHTVQVRPLADPNSKLHYSGGLLAEARAQLAMGAVGLAIESFRTLQREQPDSVDAYAGLAASYAAMGRYDLTRTNYELALAYAPNDPALLQALASTLDRLGENEQAAQVRTEVRVEAARAATPRPVAPTITPLGVPRATSMTVKVPEPVRVAATAQNAAPPIAAPKLGTASVDLAYTKLANMTKSSLLANPEFAMPREEVPANVLALAQEAARSAGSLLLPTAKVAMPVGNAPRLPHRGIEPDVHFTVAQEPEAPVAVAIKTRMPAAPAPVAVRVAREESRTATQSGPFLERTSLGEVALITVARPITQARLQPRAPQLPRLAFIAAPLADRPPAPPVPKPLLAAAALRWVPLKYASRPQNIALLNAARTDGLAARTRASLVDRGWHKIAIGNARGIRQHSLVLYAPGRMHVAARLAAQFRCKAIRVASMKSVIVLLGRDAANRRGVTARA